MPITALYASLLVPIFIVLCARVIRVRKGERVSVGDGGSASLLRRMRVQANFAEYVPLALILMAVAESLRTQMWILHTLGIMLVVARLAHAIGMSSEKDVFPMRAFGMVLTFTVLGALGLICFLGSLRNVI